MGALRSETGAYAFAAAETHLPNAFFLLVFVPYLLANAAREASVLPRSVAHCLAARLRAVAAARSAASACSFAVFAAPDTHLPNVRYLAVNASCVAALLPRSKRHSCAALERSVLVGLPVAPAVAGS